MIGIHRAALAFLLLMAPFAKADASEGVEAGNRAAVAESFAAWRAGTGSPFDVLASDAVWTIEGFSSTAGSYTPEELKALVAPFNAALAGPLVPSVPALYAERHKVENFFQRIKRFRRIALRCEKTLRNFMAFLYLVSALDWLR